MGIENGQAPGLEQRVLSRKEISPEELWEILPPSVVASRDFADLLNGSAQQTERSTRELNTHSQPISPTDKFVVRIVQLPDRQIFVRLANKGVFEIAVTFPEPPPQKLSPDKQKSKGVEQFFGSLSGGLKASSYERMNAYRDLIDAAESGQQLSEADKARLLEARTAITKYDKDYPDNRTEGRSARPAGDTNAGSVRAKAEASPVTAVEQAPDAAERERMRSTIILFLERYSPRSPSGNRVITAIRRIADADPGAVPGFVRLLDAVQRIETLVYPAPGELSKQGGAKTEDISRAVLASVQAYTEAMKIWRHNADLRPELESVRDDLNALVRGTEATLEDLRRQGHARGKA